MDVRLALQFRYQLRIARAPTNTSISQHGKEGGKAQIGLALPGAAEELKSGIDAGGVIHSPTDYTGPRLSGPPQLSRTGR